MRQFECSKQIEEFKKMCDEELQTHISKNADYGPFNILATGDIGLVVRMLDKVLRLANLLGFTIKAEFVSYKSPKEPKNESIDDTLKDISVYAKIQRIYRKGLWGK